MLGLLPFALTNLKSLVSPALLATDASPTGAGSCVARQIKREPGACNPGDLLCGSCRKDMSEAMAVCRRWTAHSSAEGIFVRSDVIPGPSRTTCSPGSASVQQALEWAETEAMLKQGFDVLPPFDRARGPDMDFFTEEGKSQWRVLAEEDPEHHAPDCKTMSRARGKPF